MAKDAQRRVRAIREPRPPGRIRCPCPTPDLESLLRIDWTTLSQESLTRHIRNLVGMFVRQVHVQTLRGIGPVPELRTTSQMLADLWTNWNPGGEYIALNECVGRIGLLPQRFSVAAPDESLVLLIHAFKHVSSPLFDPVRAARERILTVPHAWLDDDRYQKQLHRYLADCIVRMAKKHRDVRALRDHQIFSAWLCMAARMPMDIANLASEYATLDLSSLVPEDEIVRKPATGTGAWEEEHARLLADVGYLHGSAHLVYCRECLVPKVCPRFGGTCPVLLHYGNLAVHCE